MLMHDFLEYYARNLPEYISVRQGDTMVSYHELNQASNQIADGLEKLGFDVGDRIAVLGENSPEHISVLMAASKLRAVQVPLNYRLTASELAFVISNADVKVMLGLDG